MGDGKLAFLELGLLFLLFLVGIVLVMLNAWIAGRGRGGERNLVGLWGIGLLSFALRFIILFDPAEEGTFTADRGLTFFCLSAYLVTLHAWIADDRRRRDMLSLFGFGFLWFALRLVVFERGEGGLRADDVVSIGRGFALFLIFLVGVDLIMLRAWVGDFPRNRDGLARDLPLPVAGDLPRQSLA